MKWTSPIISPALAFLAFLIGALLIVIGASRAVYASDGEAILDKAFAVYAEAQAATDQELRMNKFSRAQQLFMQAAGVDAAQQGETVSPQSGQGSAFLWTNIGTAALQAENLGVAVLAYRRALSLDPGLAQAKQNLKHARSLLPSFVPTPEAESVLDSFFFWHKSMTVKQRAGTAAFAFFFACFGFAAAIRWSSSLARNLSFLPLLIWLGLTISVATDYANDDGNQAVIVVDDTIARAADSINSPMRFSQPLPAGTEVNVVQSRADWAKISLSNGRDAWVSRNSLAFVNQLD